MNRAEIEQDEVGQPKVYHYFSQQLVHHVHHYYISQSIDEPIHYVEMIHHLQTASPGHVIWIHLNTPGGHLSTGVQLINAMQASDAHIVTSIEGEVASMGTLIFLAGDEFVVHDNSLMMFHNYSGGVFGKGHEQIAALEATTKWTTEIMKRLYIPFISEDEMNRLQKGEDLYFHAEEIRTRLANMVEVLEQQAQEAAELAEDEANSAEPEAEEQPVKATQKRGRRKKSD